MINENNSDYFNNHLDQVYTIVNCKEQFNQIYQYPESVIYTLNEKIYERVKNARSLSIISKSGTDITATLSNQMSWSNTMRDELLPSEVATSCKNINGTYTLKGTMLSTIPFALKHDLLKEKIIFEISDSKIIDFKTDNVSLAEDLAFYFSNHDTHTHVEELGIGTNIGIQQLYGINSPFEERYPGLHLGLSGGEPNTHHLDLISSDSLIYTDDKLLFDGKFHV